MQARGCFDGKLVANFENWFSATGHWPTWHFWQLSTLQSKTTIWMVTLKIITTANWSSHPLDLHLSGAGVGVPICPWRTFQPLGFLPHTHRAQLFVFIVIVGFIVITHRAKGHNQTEDVHTVHRRCFFLARHLIRTVDCYTRLFSAATKATNQHSQTKGVQRRYGRSLLGNDWFTQMCSRSLWFIWPPHSHYLPNTDDWNTDEAFWDSHSSQASLAVQWDSWGMKRKRV